VNDRDDTIAGLQRDKADLIARLDWCTTKRVKCELDLDFTTKALANCTLDLSQCHQDNDHLNIEYKEEIR
jgi:hypothetical protein